jgi:hypothetical protein
MEQFDEMRQSVVASISSSGPEEDNEIEVMFVGDEIGRIVTAEEDTTSSSSEGQLPFRRVVSDNIGASVLSKTNSAVKDYEAFYFKQFGKAKLIAEMDATDFSMNNLEAFGDYLQLVKNTFSTAAGYLSSIKSVVATKFGGMDQIFSKWEESILAKVATKMKTNFTTLINAGEKPGVKQAKIMTMNALDLLNFGLMKV